MRLASALLASALLLLASNASAQTTAPAVPPGASAAPPAARAGRAGRGQGAAYTPLQADFTIKDFKFNAGGTMDVRIHYRTLGTLKKDANGQATNAILIMHGTTGTGAQFMANYFAGELFGPGQPFDITQFYLIFPDDIGHGGSSKPSDGMKAKFPNYGYEDMIRAEYQLLTAGLGVNHLRLVFGTSMGGMHSWLWPERYPDFMDGAMPMASLPEQISGRNRQWRQILTDAIRTDPEWQNGDYTKQPQSLRTASGMMSIMGGNPITTYKSAPTGDRAARSLESSADSFVRTHDANDVLYAFESSRDYDPQPDLGKIKCPLLAINTYDDLINPGELGILEKEIKNVPHGRGIVIPLSPETRGHGSHTMAALWKNYLIDFMKETEKKN